MSIALGAAENGKICIGADTLGIYENGEFIKRKDKKIFKIGDRFLVAYTGSFRIGQKIKYAFSPPIQDDDMNDHAYLCTFFIEELKELLADEYQEEWSIIIGYRGNIYTIQSDFQVSFPEDGYDAQGAGYQYALAAYKLLTKYSDLSLKERIERSLNITSSFSYVIRPPFNIEIEG